MQEIDLSNFDELSAFEYGRLCGGSPGVRVFFAELTAKCVTKRYKYHPSDLASCLQVVQE